VEASEFQRALDKMGLKVSTSAVEEMMRNMDEDSDGTMNCEEFVAFGMKLIMEGTDVSGSAVHRARLEELSKPKVVRETRAEVMEKVERIRREAKEEKARAVRARKEKEVVSKQFVESAAASFAQQAAELEERREAERVAIMEEEARKRARMESKYEREWFSMVHEERSRIERQKREARNLLDMERSIEEARRSHGEKGRLLKKLFVSEQSITADFLVRTVGSAPRRLASPGFPVKLAERGAASKSMEVIAGVYMGGKSSSRETDSEEGGGGGMFDTTRGKSGEEARRCFVKYSRLGLGGSMGGGRVVEARGWCKMCGDLGICPGVIDEDERDVIFERAAADAAAATTPAAAVIKSTSGTNSVDGGGKRPMTRAGHGRGAEGTTLSESGFFAALSMVCERAGKRWHVLARGGRRKGGSSRSSKVQRAETALGTMRSSFQNLDESSSSGLPSPQTAKSQGLSPLHNAPKLPHWRSDRAAATAGALVDQEGSEHSLGRGNVGLLESAPADWSGVTDLGNLLPVESPLLSEPAPR
jgi:hypothetical protein